MKRFLKLFLIAAILGIFLAPGSASAVYVYYGVFGGPGSFTDVAISGTLTVDAINEYTSTAGVTIDGLLVKDLSVGTTGTRAVKVWTADIESDNEPTVGGTVLRATIGFTGLTDNRLLRADSTDGVQDSGIGVDDSDNVTGIASVQPPTTADFVIKQKSDLSDVHISNALDGEYISFQSLDTALPNTIGVTAAGTTVDCTAHALAVGDAVRLPSGTGSIYEVFTVDSVTNANQFEIDSAATITVVAGNGFRDNELFNVRTGDQLDLFSFSRKGYFKIHDQDGGSSHIILRNSASGALFLRNAADSAYANLSVKTLNAQTSVCTPLVTSSGFVDITIQAAISGYDLNLQTQLGDSVNVQGGDKNIGSFQALDTALSDTSTTWVDTAVASTGHGLVVGDAIRLPSGAASAFEVFTVSAIPTSDTLTLDSSPSNDEAGGVTVYSDNDLFIVRTGDQQDLLSVSRGGIITGPTAVNYTTDIKTAGYSFLWRDASDIVVSELTDAGGLWKKAPQFMDDFLGVNASQWAEEDTGGTVLTPQNTSGGWSKITSGAAAGTDESMDWNNICNWVNTLQPYIRVVFQVEEVDDTEFQIGLWEISTGGDDDYIVVQIDPSVSANIQLIVSDGGVTSTATGPAFAALTSYDVKVWFTSDTAIDWEVNGTGYDAISTNIPTAQLQPWISVDTEVANDKYALVDKFFLAEDTE